MEAVRVWNRPESVPYPSVWLRCTGKVPMPDGKIPKFKIQDLTEDMHEEIIKMMSNIFLRDEIMCNAAGIPDDPVSLKEFQGEWRKILSQKVALVALVDEELNPGQRPRIAGCNITRVIDKTDKKLTGDMYEGEAMKLVIRFIFEYALGDVDICEYYGVDAYMSALGLFVHPDFRGQGLSEQILRARFPLCRAVGLKAMMTFFSSRAAHRAGEKAGMHIIKDVIWEEYKENGKPPFFNLPSKTLRIMGARVD